MIHTNRIVTVGEQESIIDRPIVLYRGDREVEIEFTLVGNEFTFSKEGNVIKSVNASHGQLVLNTPSGEHMFSELAECHEGKVVFVVTKEMIDEFVEMGFYSFQIRLYDSAEMKSRVTIPPVMNGFDIRNPIAAEDETNAVDQGIVDYARIFKDQSNEELPTFDWKDNYVKTEWVHHDVITENKLNKIEDALYSINANIKETDMRIVDVLDNVKKDADAYVKEHIAEVEADVAEFERNINTDVQKFKIDTTAAVATYKNEVEGYSGAIESINTKLSDISINVNDFGAVGDGKKDDTKAIKDAISECSNLGGGTVFLPTGEYVITDSLNLPWGVNLIGIYEKSVIKPKFDTGYALILNGRHHIENIKFYYEDNDVSITTTPKVFPAAIYSNNLGYSVLRNIGLGNSYIGMYLKTISGGCSIENIYGYPLKTGINIEHCIDVTPINRVHFNPNFYGSPKIELRKFVFENGEALKIGRLDFCNVDRAFAWGYKTLVTLTDSPNGGSANNIKFTNWIADACQTFCIFEHHDGGISFINGTGTFYNPYESEENQNNITTTVLSQFAVTVKGGNAESTWGGNLVSFINNRFYRAENHFLKSYNPIIFNANEIINYANSRGEDESIVISAIELNEGSDNSVIDGNYIDGKNKAQNRCIAVINSENCKINNNTLIGYKATDIYINSKNIYIDSVLYSNKEDIPSNIRNGQIIYIKSLGEYYKKSNNTIIPLYYSKKRKTITSPNADDNTVDVTGINVLINNGSEDYILTHLTGGVLNQRVAIVNQGSIARVVIKAGGKIKVPNNEDFILDTNKGFVDLICVDEINQNWVLKP